MLDRIAFAVAESVRTNRLTTHEARWPALAKSITKHDMRASKDGTAVVFAVMTRRRAATKTWWPSPR